MSPVRVFDRLLAAVSLAAIMVTTVVVTGLVMGYRPVVVLTGSMGEAAPAGSLIVAQPVPADQVMVGDVVVMVREGKATVTHRVVEIESSGVHRFAITKGDANETIDAAPYPLTREQLTARWVRPGLGRWIGAVFRPGPALAVIGITTLILSVRALRSIWAVPLNTGQAGTGQAGTGRASTVRASTGQANRRQRRGRRRLGRLAVGPVLSILTAGVAWAVFTSTDEVVANEFSVAGCLDPQLDSVQNGEQIHAVDGTVTVPIAPVDPTRSFVMASMRSNSPVPSDSTAQVALSSDGTSVQIFRNTSNPTPPAVTVGWSVVSYACGVNVQRGIVAGTAAPSVNVGLSTVDPASSFALVSTAAPPTDTSFDGDDLVRTTIAANSLTIESAGPLLTTTRSFAWQVISFNDPADATSQTVDVSLPDGTDTVTATLPATIDPTATFLLVEPTSDAPTANLDTRLVRAELTGPTTVEITRANGTGHDTFVRVRAVTLHDGTLVRHGTLTMGSGADLATVATGPYDPTRVTAAATVATPSSVSGGRTTHSADTTAGEASVLVTATDGTTLSLARSATVSASSFGWQLIEWAGPQWWDTAYPFRQRVDVNASTVDIPDGYTVPVTIDHAALVTLGASNVDGSDVRLLRWDGTAWVELDRVLDTDSAWNQTDTTFWFRTTDPIGSGLSSHYWLYYGNATPAPPPDNPDNVYLLTEDFESGDTGSFTDRTAGTAWYQADPWATRVDLKVVAGTVSADLVDYPLLVSLTHAGLSAQAQPDGSDIRFVAADGTTLLDHEIDHFDPATGELAVWVRIPVLTTATDTDFQLLFGAANAPDGQNHRGVWGAETSAWHLSRDPSLLAPQFDDSGAANRDGLGLGSQSFANHLAGRVGKGVEMNGTDMYFQSAPVALDGLQSLTMSAWVAADTYTGDSRIINQGGATPGLDLWVSADGTLNATVNLAGTGPVTVSGGSVWTVAWHRVAAVWDGATLGLWVNGAEVATTPAAGVLASAGAGGFTVAATGDGLDGYDGRIDEIRFEPVARSAAWMEADWDSLDNPAGFVTVGATTPGSWLGQGTWSWRKPLVVDADQVAADLSGHSLFVSVDDPDLAAGTNADGSDLVFTAADGVTRLDHVVEYWDPATGSLRAWVWVPTLSGTADTGLFVYYGNPTAVDQQDVGAFGPDADLVITRP